MYLATAEETETEMWEQEYEHIFKTIRKGIKKGHWTHKDCDKAINKAYRKVKNYIEQGESIKWEKNK